MHYWLSYRFVFRSVNWMTNLVLTGVCMLIPWIGQMVVIGYLFELIDVWHFRRQLTRRNPEGRSPDGTGELVMDALLADEDHPSGDYPDFNFNRFSEYLTRGIWPFLIQMIANMTAGMLAGLVFMVCMILASVAAAAANEPLLFFAVYGVFWLAYGFLMMIASIVTTPWYLRAGLSGDFASAFSMEFYLDFMKRVGKEVVLAELFLAATGTMLTIAGLAFCYVGIFPALSLIYYAHHHVDYQLYELYLDRGGVPVQRKEKQSAAEERYLEDDDRFVGEERLRPEERSTDVMRSDESW